VKANPNVKGEAAVKAVGDQRGTSPSRGWSRFRRSWSRWTRRSTGRRSSGDAFLADQKAVLDAVQRLRTKAQASGNLKTTEQQKVVVQQQAQQQVIIIEPRSLT